jgi:hypothetical protein
MTLFAPGFAHPEITLRFLRDDCHGLMILDTFEDEGRQINEISGFNKWSLPTIIYKGHTKL